MTPYGSSIQKVSYNMYNLFSSFKVDLLEKVERWAKGWTTSDCKKTGIPVIPKFGNEWKNLLI